MAEVEEELMNMEEEELDHMEGEVHENGEELNEDKEKDLDGIKLEVVEGNKEGSRWLIVDSVHICHKQQVFQNHDVWRCEDFRDYKCPFKIITTKEESENGLQIVTMTKKLLHNCSKDKVKPILHKFRLKLAKRMRADLDTPWPGPSPVFVDNKFTPGKWMAFDPIPTLSLRFFWIFDKV